MAVTAKNEQINQPNNWIKMNFNFRYPGSFLLGLFLLVSCESDPCEGINCDNGVCDTVTGLCICSRGYQRDTTDICNQTWTEKFVGNYAVEDSCTGTNAGTSFYPSSVTALSASSLELSVLGNLTQAVTGKLNNSSIFVVDSVFSGGFVLTGSGSLLDSTIVLNYILSDTMTGVVDTCTAIFTP